MGQFHFTVTFAKLKGLLTLVLPRLQFALQIVILCLRLAMVGPRCGLLHPKSKSQMIE